jgi:nucleoid-associated protein EbfC
MTEAQTELSQHHETGNSGGGLVAITLNGKGEMTSIKIDPSIIKEDEIDIMEDLIIAAYNDAKKKTDSYASTKMGGVTNALSIPNLFN